MTRHRCARCGADPAAGFAKIGDRRYCHEGDSPTCYELGDTDDGEQLTKFLRRIDGHYTWHDSDGTLLDEIVAIIRKHRDGGTP